MEEADLHAILPSSPEDRKRIMRALQEMSVTLTRIDMEREHLSDIQTQLKEKFELPKKLTRQLAMLYHKQSADSFREVNDLIVDMYEVIFSGEKS